MKTAVEEFIDYAKSVWGWDEEFEAKAKQLLKKENEQLKEMYLKGIENYDPTFKRKSQWTPVEKKKSI